MAGILSRGMIHDFNNLLVGVAGPASLMMLTLDNSKSEKADKLKSNIKIIQSSVDKAIEIINRLKKVTRTKQLSLEIVELNAIIQETGMLCETAYGKDVSIQILPYENKAEIMGDSVSLEQILLNLCLNGIHSMTIMDTENKIKNKFLKLSIHQIYHVTLGPSYCIIVSDKGVGMSEETIQQLREPFFTTKDSKNGTGLGIPMVYHMVEQMNGVVEIESTQGKGSQFKVYFPAVVKKEVVESASPDNMQLSSIK
jgi:two-component system cell cycle sensor histidine kinase/response regulator CckA